MTRTALKTVAAAVVAATIGSAALTVPAAAGGSISVNIAPTDPQQAQALQAGLQIYGIVNAVKKGGGIKQIGINNLAGILQAGSGNYGVVHQEGSGHSGTLQQYGNNNSYGIFQFGKNTNADVVQNGNNGVGATVQFGW